MEDLTIYSLALNEVSFSPTQTTAIAVIAVFETAGVGTMSALALWALYEIVRGRL